MNKHGKEYLNKHIFITAAIEKKIIAHAKRYNISGDICAYYYDWEDFCSDWCDGCGYSRSEARKIFHGGIGEFMKLPDNLGIIRFVL